MVRFTTSSLLAFFALIIGGAHSVSAEEAPDYAVGDVLECHDMRYEITEIADTSVRRKRFTEHGIVTRRFGYPIFAANEDESLGDLSGFITHGLSEMRYPYNYKTGELFTPILLQPTETKLYEIEWVGAVMKYNPVSYGLWTYISHDRIERDYGVETSVPRYELSNCTLLKND